MTPVFNNQIKNHVLPGMLQEWPEMKTENSWREKLQNHIRSSSPSLSLPPLALLKVHMRLTVPAELSGKIANAGIGPVAAGRQ